MLPFEEVTAFFESETLVECNVPMVAFATFGFSPLVFVDTVDFLRKVNSDLPWGGVNVAGFRDAADRRPSSAVPAFYVDYFIHAERAGVLEAPGTLILIGGIANPATGLDSATQRVVGAIQYRGSAAITDDPALNFQGNIIGKRGVAGTVRIRSRLIGAVYENGAFAQTAFALGVYLRMA